MSKILLAAFISLLSAISWARGSSEVSFSTKEGTVYVVVRSEADADRKTADWQVDIYESRPGRFQERTDLRHFRTEKEAQAFARQYRQQHELIRQEDGDLPVRQAAPVDGPMTEVPGNVLWEPTQEWSWDWEVRYAEWVKKNITSDFFLKNKIRTDCADVAIGARWIFARINGLPMANTLAGSGMIFSQASMRTEWAALPRDPDWRKDQAFLAALDYVLDETYTRSLMKDSYPVQVNPQIFLPGVHHLEFHEQTGHTMLVIKVEPGTKWGEPQFSLIQSTVPRDLRLIDVVPYVQDEAPPEGQGGFLRIRWTEKRGRSWFLKAGPEHPGYSTEQFTPEFMGNSPGFSMAIKAHLSSRYDAFKDFQGALTQLRTALKNRMNVVEQGILACQEISCAPGTPGWEEWSTPSRDARLKGMVKLAMDAVEKNQNDRRYQQAWQGFLNLKEIYIGNSTVPNARLIEAIAAGRISSDPRVELETRWGL